jgi:sulfocyanin
MRHRSIVAVVIALLLAALVALPANAASVTATKPKASAPTWLVYNASAHTATLTMIAAYNTNLSGFNFNGYGQGKMVVTLPLGTKLTVKFSNKASLPHSWVLTPFAKHTASAFPTAVKGAATPNPTSGTTMGTNVTLHFTATPAGTYAMVCAVPGHAAAGMWDTLIIAKGTKASIILKK